MEYMFDHLIKTVLNVFFNGGIKEFAQQGGLCIIPDPGKEIVVYHPDITEELIERLKALENNKGKNTINIMKEKNFKDASIPEIIQINVELNKKIERLCPEADVLFATNSNLVVISLPDIKNDEDILELIFGCLRNTDGLSLAYVITEKKVYKITPEISKHIPKIENKNERGGITEDDITNLIIDLNRANSIEDLLK
jgi:hypothetical protein